MKVLIVKNQKKEVAIYAQKNEATNKLHSFEVVSHYYKSPLTGIYHKYTDAERAMNQIINQHK